MAHDARTTSQAILQGLHAQCSLAAARNLMRDPTLTAASLAKLCLDPEYPEDIRVPDWPRVLTTMASEGEVVKRGSWGMVRPSLYLDMRLAVSISATHVVGLVRDTRTPSGYTTTTRRHAWQAHMRHAPRRRYERSKLRNVSLP